jgi:hypothetical protein
MSNFIALYMHAVGEGETPKAWNFWTCMALIAGCLQDRVYVDWNGRITKPNLYTILIGPSGGGKGSALRFAFENFLAEDACPVAYHVVKPTAGRYTMQAIYDRLRKLYPPVNLNGQRICLKPKAFLIQEELRDCVGTGQRAYDFVSGMTATYNALSEHGEVTRHLGNNAPSFRDICLNWLAGTTPVWYLQAVGPDAIESGFAARINFIWGKVDYNNRQPLVKIPPDQKTIIEHLRYRTAAICLMEGPMILSPTAVDAYTNWYVNTTIRPNPRDSVEAAPWRRVPEMAMKFAIVFAVADASRTIEAQHMQMAIQHSWNLYRNTTKLRKLSPKRTDVAATDVVATYIKRKTKEQGFAWRSDLLTSLRNGYGLGAADVQVALRQLMDEGRITYLVRHKREGARGADTYEWIDTHEEEEES